MRVIQGVPTVKTRGLEEVVSGKTESSPKISTITDYGKRVPFRFFIFYLRILYQTFKTVHGRGTEFVKRNQKSKSEGDTFSSIGYTSEILGGSLVSYRVS